MKKKHEEGHENTERYLLTYSDMITLLMLFFIVLYSMSNIDAEKYKQLSGSLESVFTGGNFGIFNNSALPGQGGIMSGGRGIMDSAGQLPSQKGSSTIKKKAKVSSINNSLKRYVEANKAQVVSSEIGITIILQSDLMFDAGSSEILPETREVLDKVADVLKSMDNNIRIEGHTDDQPLKDSNIRFRSNWELSSERATKILEQLVEQGINPGRLSSVSYGSTRPRVSNNTPEDRALNRRVEITIVDQKDE